jgi:hypothetical protein
MLLIGGCFSMGPSGELWLRLEQVEPDGDRLTLTLPASTLRDPGEPALLETTGGDVDLRPEARRLRVGQERSWTLDEGTATLTHAPPAPGAATEVAIGITGKRGRGLSVNVPLQPEDMDQVRDKVQVDLDAPVDIDATACAQWRRSPPTPILEVVGPNGNGLRVATR